jgi:hypothetical protein
MKVQLNFQVPSSIAGKVRSDARRNKKTLDDVGTTILSDFFNSWSVAERAKFYAHAAPKRAGRRIAA